MSNIRKNEVYGKWILSVQASEKHECVPQVGDCNTPLDHYDKVEVAILDSEGNMYLPSKIKASLAEFDRAFSRSNSGKLNTNQLNRIRHALFKITKPEDIQIPNDGRLSTFSAPLIAKVRLGKIL